jgi:hypothetical protein
MISATGLKVKILADGADKPGVLAMYKHRVVV